VELVARKNGRRISVQAIVNGHRLGFRLSTLRIGLKILGQSTRVRPYTPGWGFVHLQITPSTTQTNVVYRIRHALSHPAYTQVASYHTRTHTGTDVRIHTIVVTFTYTRVSPFSVYQFVCVCGRCFNLFCRTHKHQNTLVAAYAPAEWITLHGATNKMFSVCLLVARQPAGSVTILDDWCNNRQLCHTRVCTRSTRHKLPCSAVESKQGWHSQSSSTIRM